MMSTTLHDSGLDRHFSETQMSLPSPLKKGLSTTTILLLFLIVLIVAAFTSSLQIHTFRFSVNNSIDNTVIVQKHQNPPKEIIIPLNCTAKNQTQTCPTNYPRTFQTTESDPSSKPTCPEYFRWIHEDLRPWKVSGVTKDMMARAKQAAYFRLIIVNNKVYIERYRKSRRTRFVFTIWGILQLVRKYPGRLPDLDLMFDTDDRPVIQSWRYRGPNTTSPPPLFTYSGDNWTMDIVFPDWSFWGWLEVNIKPWDNLLREIIEGTKRSQWIEREPYAYWKGNSFGVKNRRDLLTCNVSDKQDWNARIYAQDWILESQQGFKQSNLANQCTHRYKIYVEGWAWSVSGKYILACDSMTLFVKPHYYDFFTRYLQPLQHYWPIREHGKCKSIKFAVDWGNNHKRKAQEIGKAASSFIQEELKMDYVYDYMFHLLNEYSKLLKFKPVVPDGAVEVCSETMACMADGLEKKFKMESLVKGPSITSPCTMPPPYETKFLAALNRRKVDAIRQVEIWEDKYWNSFNVKPRQSYY